MAESNQQINTMKELCDAITESKKMVANTRISELWEVKELLIRGDDAKLIIDELNKCLPNSIDKSYSQGNRLPILAEVSVRSILDDNINKAVKHGYGSVNDKLSFGHNSYSDVVSEIKLSEETYPSIFNMLSEDLRHNLDALYAQNEEMQVLKDQNSNNEWKMLVSGIAGGALAALALNIFTGNEDHYIPSQQAAPQENTRSCDNC